MMRRILVGGWAVAFSLSFGCGFFAKPKPAAPPLAPTVLATAEMEPEPFLTNPDVSLDKDLISSTDVQRLEDVKVTEDDKVTAPGQPGSADEFPGSSIPVDSSVKGNDLGSSTGYAVGDDVASGGLGGNLPAAGFAGRSGATRSVLVAQTGCNTASDAAVIRGLAWLSKQQKPNGTWAFDGQKSADVPAATGMALLPFLAAGCSHKPGTSNNTYTKTVMQGLRALVNLQQSDGSFKGSGDQYSHAIATLALAEAYGLTQDRALLHVSAQKAIDRLQQSQATDGSWGYSPHSAGDTSITGWQIQALYAAKLTKALKVEQKVLDKANAFLDTVAEGKAKEKYGYRSPTGTPTMTAVGLLARVQSGAWTPENPGYAEGVKYLLANAVPQKELRDSYFVYYATQVLFRHGGEAWAKQWNPQVRDLLASTQQTNDTGGHAGSWDRDQALIGTYCGRLGTTALALLSLEVYYRYPQSEEPAAVKPAEPAK